MNRRTRDDLAFRVLRVVLGVGSRLPLRVSRWCGRWLLRLAWPFMKRDRRRMAEHIAIAFPELGRTQQNRLRRASVLHLGNLLGEIAWLWGADAGQVEAVCEVEGVEHLFDALDAGRGAILATGHLGNWELLNARLAVAGVPITIAVRELDDSRVDELVTTLRSRFGSEVVPRGTSAGRQLLRALARDRGIGLLVDQDIPSIPGIFVPFFGRDAWTPSGAAMLSLRARCPLMPGFIHRKPDGSHKVKIGPPFPVPTEGTLQDKVRELTAAATAAVEWQVRAWPEQWVWMHRRWRTRPEHEEVAPEPDQEPDQGPGPNPNPDPEREP